MLVPRCRSSKATVCCQQMLSAVSWMLQSWNASNAPASPPVIFPLFFCYLSYLNSLSVFPYAFFRLIHVFMNLCPHLLNGKVLFVQRLFVTLSKPNWKKNVFVCQTCICCLNIYRGKVLNAKPILLKCTFHLWRILSAKPFMSLLILKVFLFLPLEFLWGGTFLVVLKQKLQKIKSELGPVMSNSIHFIPKMWKKTSSRSSFLKKWINVCPWKTQHLSKCFLCLDFENPNVILVVQI